MRIISIATFVVAFCNSVRADWPYRIVVTDTKGSPVAGARVWAYGNTTENYERNAPEPLSYVTDVQGVVKIPPDKLTAARHHHAFALAADGRMGSTVFSSSPDRTVYVELIALTKRSGTVRTPDGKPVVGAEVESRGLSQTPRDRYSVGPSISVPPWVWRTRPIVTDANGRFEIDGRDAWDSIIQIRSGDLIDSSWVLPAKGAWDITLEMPGRVTFVIEGIAAEKLAGASWNLRGDEWMGRPMVTPIRSAHGLFDATGRAMIPPLEPGRYKVSVWNKGQIPGVVEAITDVEIVAGETKTATIRVGPAAKVTGRIVDMKGNGVAGIDIRVNVTDVSQRKNLAILSARTDENGQYVVHGPAGQYYGFPSPEMGRSLPDRFAMPPNRFQDRYVVKPVDLELGESKAFDPVVLPDAIPTAVRILKADGSPAIGAIALFRRDYEWATRTADAEGRVRIPNLAADDEVCVRIRDGRDVTTPIVIQPAKEGKDLTVTIHNDSASVLSGRVLDEAGKPVGNAILNVRHVVQGDGRMKAYSSTSTYATLSTGPDGRFTLTGLFPNDSYFVIAEAEGHSKAETTPTTAVAGKSIDVGTISLVRSNYVVAGTVVDDADRPVPHAELFSVDGPHKVMTRSAIDGSFTLAGFLNGPGFVIARASGYRMTAVAANPLDGKPVRVVMTSVASPDPVRTTDPAILSARSDLAKQMLKAIWEGRAALQNGRTAVRHMAMLDPATAKAWRDEEWARSNGANDYSRDVARGIRMTTPVSEMAKDVAGTIASLRNDTPEYGAFDATQIAERILPTHREAARAIAEEAAALARSLDGPRRLSPLAIAADLLRRTGAKDEADRAFAEAAEGAANLAPDQNGINAHTICTVSGRIAAHDPDLSEKLRDRLKHPVDYNRAIAEAAITLARENPAKIRELMKKLKRENVFESAYTRIRIAAILAKTDPEEAVALFDTDVDRSFRVLGLLRLAIEFEPTERGRAMAFIERAFDIMERQVEYFVSHTGIGGVAAYAGTVTARAHLLGLPGTSERIARTLALRSRSTAFSADGFDQSTASLAAILAIADPAIARHLLTTIRSKEAVDRFPNARDTLFARALADPAGAKESILNTIENAKGKGLGMTGILELLMVLTEPDPLHGLSSWGRVPKEIKDDGR